MKAWCAQGRSKCGCAGARALLRAAIGCGWLLLWPWLSPAQPACVASPSGLISWWPAEGSAADVIGGNNGIVLSGANYAGGESGQAFSFSGNTVNCIRIPYNHTLITPAYTIEAWVNPVVQINDPVNQKVLFAQNGGQVALLAQPGSTGVRVLFAFADGAGSWHII